VCTAKRESDTHPWVVKQLGRMTSREINHEIVKEAAVGQEIAMKIEGEPEVTFGRHFSETDLIYSVVSRDSIDALRGNCRELLRTNKELVELIKQLKLIFSIYP